MPIQLDETETSRLLKSLTLPPLPAVLNEVRAAQSRGADTLALAQIVGQDLSLSAAVLKTANSPAFAGRQFDSLQDALLYLGGSNLDAIVTGVALKQNIPLPPILGMFWDEATRIAAIAARLAQHYKLVRPDQAYLFCLFRDCGIPVLVQRFPNYVATLARAMAQPGQFIEIELKSRASSHVVVGYLLARTWFMPETLSLAIFHHHDFTKLADENCMPLEAAHLIALARLAEHLLHRSLREDSDAHWSEIAAEVLNALGLADEPFDEIAAVADILD